MTAAIPPGLVRIADAKGLAKLVKAAQPTATSAEFVELRPSAMKEATPLRVRASYGPRGLVASAKRGRALAPSSNPAKPGPSRRAACREFPPGAEAAPTDGALVPAQEVVGSPQSLKKQRLNLVWTADTARSAADEGARTCAPDPHPTTNQESCYA
jgi:hypothetical protein